MKISSLKWLLCATILASQPALAEEVSKKPASKASGIETLAIPNVESLAIKEQEQPSAKKAVAAKNKAAPKKKKILKEAPAEEAVVVKDAPASKTSETVGLSLNGIIEKALLQSPRLKAFRSSIAAAKGERAQASAWSNPEIGIDAENVAGTGPYKGVSSVESTVGVTQLFEIGGKISARERIADKGLEIASLNEHAAALDVIRDVTIAYAEVIAAEENARLASEQKDLAEDVLKSVSVRVNAAAAPLIQKSRAEVERSTAKIELDKANRARDIARKKLATIMGDKSFEAELNSAAFYEVDKTVMPERENSLKDSPDILKLNSELEQSKARLDLEIANAIPDPRISVGMRDYRDSSDQAFVVGFSIPIPVFNSNSGNIQKARSEILRTEFDNRQAELNVSSELTQAYEQMQGSYTTSQTLKNEMLPSATKAFGLSREGYNLGRFAYLEVLDAQRSLFDVNKQQIEALLQFHTAKAQAERLTATRLADMKNYNSEQILEDNKGENHAE